MEVTSRCGDLSFELVPLEGEECDAELPDVDTYTIEGYFPSVKEEDRKVLEKMAEEQEDWKEKVGDFKNKCDAYTIRIIASRFKCSEFDWETMQGIIDKKKLKSKVIMYGDTPEYTLVYLGVVANNRWLYTPDGKTIGKKGKSFNLEEL